MYGKLTPWQHRAVTHCYEDAGLPGPKPFRGRVAVPFVFVVTFFGNADASMYIVASPSLIFCIFNPR